MDRVIVTGSEITLRQIVNVARQGANVTLSRGVNSGYMIVQYTAAALVSENKVLAHPASVDSIPSSANQEDHVSMGTIAARKAREILENARRVLAIELMCACQAIDLRGDKGLGLGTGAAYRCVRNVVPFLTEDRLAHDGMAETDKEIIDIMLNG